jgi:hypothetical protein
MATMDNNTLLNSRDPQPERTTVITRHRLQLLNRRVKDSILLRRNMLHTLLLVNGQASSPLLILHLLPITIP